MVLPFDPLYPDKIQEEYKTLGGSTPQPHFNYSAGQVTGRVSPPINFSIIFDEVEDGPRDPPERGGVAQWAYAWIRTQLGPDTAPSQRGAKIFILKLSRAVRRVIVWSCRVYDVWQYPDGAMRRFRADFQCEEFVPTILDPSLFGQKPKARGAKRSRRPPPLDKSTKAAKMTDATFRMDATQRMAAKAPLTVGGGGLAVERNINTAAARAGGGPAPLVDNSRRGAEAAQARGDPLPTGFWAQQLIFLATPVPVAGVVRPNNATAVENLESVFRQGNEFYRVVDK